MSLYELRTYTAKVGKMPEILENYEKLGWPALEKIGGDKLVGYFVGDIGAMHQLIHIWRFEDDADRRDFWARVFADEAFMAFAVQNRPLLQSQENKLMTSAPWGPRP